MLLGKTGCGKSTTVHFLWGKQLKKRTISSIDNNNGKPIKMEQVILIPE